jgi:predicted MFS family arabinose efflux permease
VSETTLLALSFALGLFGGLNLPAFQAIQPELVPRDQLAQSMALSNTTFNVGRAIGPAIGGAVVASGGPEWVFLLNAISFLAIVLVLFRWKHSRPASSLPPETFGGATKAGLRYGMNSPALRQVMIRSFVFILPACALLTLLPVVARGPLDLGSGGFGMLLGCFGVGAAISAVLRPRIVAATPVDTLMMIATAVVAVAIVIVGVSELPILTGTTLLLAGSAWTLALTATGVAAQSALPSWVRARGLGLWNFAGMGGLVIGSIVWGAVASWSLRGAHIIAASSVVVLFVLTLRWKLSAPDRLDLELASFDDPIITLTPAPDDGPVLITIRYRVLENHYDEFVEEMRRVERQRRRTGAYRWGLFRDLADPDVVVENYLVESWAEHVRQHHRMTNTDLAVLGAARQHVAADFEITHFISCVTSSSNGRGQRGRSDVAGTLSVHGVPPDPR